MVTMKIELPIITSILDNDLYTLTVGQLVFHDFPEAIVAFDFFNRGKTDFPVGFADALREQLVHLSKLRLTAEEQTWLHTIPFLRRTYIEWLSSYQLDPHEVTITQEGGILKIHISGYWYRTIFWEVCLMAVISELYFRLTGQTTDSQWKTRIYEKASKLSQTGCHWIDFGTRRRFSLEVQDKLVEMMKDYKGFLGTSNMFLAMKYGIISHGTYSHQGPMGISALYGVRMANKMWMKHWSKHYEGNVGVALTDTFTTDAFLRDFGSYESRLFDGARQDSGDEYKWGNDMLAHYKKLGIASSNKRFVFSNALDTDKYIAIDRYFRQFAQPCGGIGTHFSNDVGCKPLNMVIKLVSADFGHGEISVVKLSDDLGKHTGNSEAIDLAKRELGIV